MSSGFYADRDSLVHRLHPVTRIVLLLMSFTSAMILEHPLWMALLLFVHAWVGYRTGVFAGLRKVIWLMFLVGFASFGIWSLSYGGPTAVLSAGPLTVTREGMLFGGGMGIRLDLMILSGLIFLASTPIEELTYGLTRMGVPFPVGFALSLSFRLVTLFTDTVTDILDAQKARGLEIKGGPIARVKIYVPLLVPVFASAMRRADQLAVALESKGFGMGRKRSSLNEYAAGARDAIVLIAMALVIAGLCAARYLGYGMVG